MRFLTHGDKEKRTLMLIHGMKYSGMPAAMWFLYRKSFQMALVNDLKKSHEEAKQIMAKRSRNIGKFSVIGWTYNRL